MLTHIIAFITSGWKNLLIKIGIIAIVFGIGFGSGYHVSSQHYQLADAKIELNVANETAARKAGQQTVTDDHELHQNTVQTKIVNHYIPVEKEVQVFRDKPDGQVTVSAETVTLFNKAVAAPEPAGQPGTSK